MAIAQRTAKALAHPLRVVSTYGKGSMFSIQVPFGDDALKPKHDRNIQLSANHYQLKGFRVLVIDNDLSIQQGMHAMLTLWGCDVYCAASAQQAVNIVESLSMETLPQLILADYHLDQNYLGTDAIVEIRQFMRQKMQVSIGKVIEQEVPAIVITADQSHQMRELTKASGFGLIHKPIKPAVLRKFINRLG